MSLLLASLAVPAAAESRFGLGLDLLFEHQESLEVSAFRGTILTRDLLRGGEQSAEQPSDPDLLNRKFNFLWELEAAGVELPIDLPGRWGLDPRLVLQAGVADVSLDFIGLRDSADSAGLSGRGPLFGAELEVEGSFGSGPLSWSGSLRWQKLPSLTVDRSPAFRPEALEVTADGVELSQQEFEVMGDEVRLSQEVQELTARVGYSVSGRTKSYLGVRYRRTNVTIEDELGYVDPLGEIETSLASLTELEGEATLAIAGVETHLGSQLHGRVETAIGERDRVVLARVVYLWEQRRTRPPHELERRASQIAKAIAPRLATIEAAFLTDWRGLKVVEGSDGEPAYFVHEVEELLARTERNLLSVLAGYRELEALGDWLQDQFDAARETLRLAEDSTDNRQTASFAVLTTSMSFPSRLSENRHAQMAQKVANKSIVDRNAARPAVTIVTRLAADGRLLIKFTFKTRSRWMPTLAIYPRYEESAEKTLPNNQGYFVFVGSYAFKVTEPGVRPFICDAEKPGAAQACPLDLVNNTCVVLQCEWLDKAGTPSPRSRAARIGCSPECP